MERKEEMEGPENKNSKKINWPVLSVLCTSSTLICMIIPASKNVESRNEGSEN